MPNKWMPKAAAANLKDKTKLEWDIVENPSDVNNDSLVTEMFMPSEEVGDAKARFLLYLAKCQIDFTPEITASFSELPNSQIKITARYSHSLELERMARNEFKFPEISADEYDKTVALLTLKTKWPWKKTFFTDQDMVSVRIEVGDIKSLAEKLILNTLRKLGVVKPKLIIIEDLTKPSSLITIHIFHPLEIKTMAQRLDEELKAKAVDLVTDPRIHEYNRPRL